MHFKERLCEILSNDASSNDVSANNIWRISGHGGSWAHGIDNKAKLDITG